MSCLSLGWHGLGMGVVASDLVSRKGFCERVVLGVENPRAAHEELLFLQYCTIWSQSGQTHVSDHDFILTTQLRSKNSSQHFAQLSTFCMLHCSAAYLAMARSSAEEGLSHSCYIVTLM